MSLLVGLAPRVIDDFWTGVRPNSFGDSTDRSKKIFWVAESAPHRLRRTEGSGKSAVYPAVISVACLKRILSASVYGTGERGDCRDFVGTLFKNR